MSVTRFMSRLFSATEQKDEELTAQVAEDIEAAKEAGSVEDDEMSYEHIGDGHVLATDKETGEVTHILPNVEDHELYDLEDVTDDVERFLHPEIVSTEGQGDVVAIAPENPAENTEKYLYPVVGDTVQYQQDLCPQTEPGQCDDPECPCNEMEEEKQFSVSSDNSIVLKTFSDQESIEEAAEETIRSEQTVESGDLKFQKLSDNEVLVTDKSTGDKAKVSLDGPELEVTELDEKNFRSYSETINKMKLRKVRKTYSEDEIQFLYVVGIDPTNQVLVNVPVNSEAAAQEMAAELAEKGVSMINIFVCPDEARDYAWQLLNAEGVESEEKVEAEEKTYSDKGVEIFCNRFYTDRTRFMNRLFSEVEAEVDATQNLLEASAEDGVQVETDSEVITPVADEVLVVEDKETGEFTKVELVDDQIETEMISEDEAKELMKDVEVAEEDPAEKQFSERGWAKVTKKFSDEDEPAEEVPAVVEEAPMEAPAEEAAAEEEEKPSLEKIEDKAQDAIEAIQETADAAVEAIEDAKIAPVEEVAEDEIKEASYSDKVFSEIVNEGANTLINW